MILDTVCEVRYRNDANIDTRMTSGDAVDEEMILLRPPLETTFSFLSVFSSRVLFVSQLAAQEQGN
jgi:hypothetical protein